MKLCYFTFIYILLLSSFLVLRASTDCDKIKNDIEQLKKNIEAFQGDVQQFKSVLNTFKDAVQDAQKKIDLYKKGALGLIAVSTQAEMGIGSCKKQFMVWAGCRSGARASIETLNLIAVGR